MAIPPPTTGGTADPLSPTYEEGESTRSIGAASSAIKSVVSKYDNNDVPRRLRSIANYGPFSPTGLACCTGLGQSEFSASLDAADDDGGGTGGSHDNRPRSEFAGRAGNQQRVSFSAAAATFRTSTPSPFASGTAIALSGPHGIAILRSNRPHVPSVLLSHSNPIRSTGAAGGRSGPLAFQPTWYETEAAPSSAVTDASAESINKSTGGAGRSTLLLATARGSGVLVWDASGRSLSPLLGRLGHDGRHPPASAAPAPSSNTVATATATSGSSSAATASSSSRPPKPGGKLPPASSSNTVTSSSLSPRSSGTPSSINYDLNRITSLCWLSPHNPTLVTTSARSACIWDLRCPSISRLRPATRFEVSETDVEFVSCAVGGDDGNEVAILDGGGVVRIYDTRIGVGGGGGGDGGAASHQHNYQHPLHAFYAHESSGVGIYRLPMSKTGRRGWLTWGFDAGGYGDFDGSVKVWREGRRDDAAVGEISIDSEDYWNPNSGVAAAVSAAASAAAADSRRYELTAMFGSSGGCGLSAARVVPYPYVNGVVTVGAGQDGDWRADFWTLDEKNASEDICASGAAAAGDANIVDGVYGARLEASFEGGYGTDTALKQVLGGSADLGHLIQADLAVGPSALHDRGQGEGAELLLCCLGSTGYLTTHAMPEALTNQASAAGASSGTLASSPTRQMASHRLVRPNLTGAVTLGEQQSKLFRPNSDPNMQRSFEKTRDEGPLGVSRRDYLGGADGNENRYSSELSKITPDDAYGYGRSSVLPAVQDDVDGVIDPVAKISRGVEGALMQFEIDVPVAHQIVSGEVASGVVGGTPVGASKSPGGGSVDVNGKNTTEQPSSSAARSTSIDPFKAMNVPCPRLCGASFGRGGGGMIVFHNGEVRRLWHWFQTDQQAPAAGVKQQQRQDESFEVDLRGRIASPAPSARRASLNAKMQQCPRTMLDLMRMNAAAKIAQWGIEGADDDGDSDKDADRSDEESDTVSDESSQSSSDSEEFESFFLQQTMAEGEGREEGSARALDIATAASRPTSVLAKEKAASSTSLSSSPPSHRFSMKRSGRKMSTGPDPDDAFINPSTDHLAPVVTFTLKYDTAAMNGQCPELADGMEFGPWWLMPDDGNFPPTMSSSALAGSRVSSRSSGLHSEGWGWIEETDRGANDNSSYRTSLFPSLSSMGRRFSMKGNGLRKDEPVSPLSPSKSFPTVQHLLAETAPMPPPLATVSEKQKRSSSMSGFKSLFYSQSPDDIAVVPPDQNMLPKARPRLASRSRDSLKEMANADCASHELGVHMVTHPEALSLLALEQLDRTVQLCLYNSAVCSDLNQSGKADTWSLLAQVVEHLEKDNRDDYDGWGGPGGGALGSDLVANILRLYEIHGDVQMLATIVCVLSGGSDRRVGYRHHPVEQQTNSSIRNLLPDDDKRLDSYIIRYSSLLYAWGKLTTRTELNKHLAHVIPGGGGEILIPIDRGDDGRLQKDFIRNDGVAPGITFAPLCPRCHKPANPETNVCNNCKQYAFKCSICMNAVRGLFTCCLTCGHGGHVEHLLPWFEKETTCPTGCGCSCVLTTYTSENVVAVGSDKAIQAKEYAPRIWSRGWQ